MTIPVVSIPAKIESKPMISGMGESLPHLATSLAMMVSLSAVSRALFKCFSQILKFSVFSLKQNYDPKGFKITVLKYISTCKIFYILVKT